MLWVLLGTIEHVEFGDCAQAVAHAPRHGLDFADVSSTVVLTSMIWTII